MPAAYLDQAQCADGYTDALTLGPDFSASKAIIVVEQNDVFMQFAQGGIGSWHWTDERDWRSIPQSLSVGKIIGIRFRNAAPGQIAIVTASLLSDDDPDFESGFPSSVKVTNTMITGQINADGSIAAGSGFTVTHLGLGHYQVTFKTAFAAAPTIWVTTVNAAGNSIACSIISVTAAGFVYSTASQASDNPVHFGAVPTV